MSYQVFGRRSGIMLCYPFEEKRLSRWKPPYLIQRKLDGARCRALCEGRKVTLVSSEGNEFKHIPHINEALSRLGIHAELDGELYRHGMGFSDIMSIVSRKVDPHPGYAEVEYHIFDVVNGASQVSRVVELETLKWEIVARNSQEELRVVDTIAVETMDDIMKAFDDFIEGGYEGFVIRDSSGVYQRKRYTGIMKFKPHQEDVYEIIGTQEEVSIKGHFKNALGAFICRGDDGSTFTVGSGSALTREARESLWKEKENLMGQHLQVKYQGLTPGRGVPRFPVALRVLDLTG
jgi:ATP-dependent DNA ligase